MKLLRYAAAELLAGNHWGGRRGSLLLASAEKGGGRHEGKDSDFHVLCVWVLTVFVWSSSTRLLAAGFCETNDKFHLCK